MASEIVIFRVTEIYCIDKILYLLGFTLEKEENCFSYFFIKIFLLKAWLQGTPAKNPETHE